MSYDKRSKKGNRNAAPASRRASGTRESGKRGTVQPDPRQIFPHRRLGKGFAPGAAATSGVAITQIVAVGALLRFRIRFMASVAGTLKVEFLSPDNNDTPYVANQPATAAVTANTGTKLDVDPHFGEGLMLLTFTPSATGTITYCDVMGV